MNAHDVLIAARAKIERPENWTQKAIARTSKGLEVGPDNPEAVCWCAIGAACAASRGDGELEGLAIDALKRSVCETEGCWTPVAKFNDSRSHDDVLAMYDRAIAAAKSARDAHALRWDPENVDGGQ